MLAPIITISDIAGCIKNITIIYINAHGESIIEFVAGHVKKFFKEERSL